MTRYLLDTNIISNVTRPSPSPALLDWLGAQIDTDLYISSLTIAELHRGILKLPVGRKRRDLEGWFGGPEGPLALFAGRVLAFDEKAALIFFWGRAAIVAGKARGYPRSARDMIIAAVAKLNGCLVVTDNERGFAGIELLRP